MSRTTHAGTYLTAVAGGSCAIKHDCCVIYRGSLEESGFQTEDSMNILTSVMKMGTSMGPDRVHKKYRHDWQNCQELQYWSKVSGVDL
ncbi:hypothetical protein AVEN_263595-1 [Araneus ventricosus]|uniref:Uncharacterized protein n=1 Tax=Araneus ventricosus TaxID=182803 RepID=A0A4Y2I002_ARAVE|nr:hypothetical protein AVEN_263595-1 [Araneus ventricosus]